MNDQLVSIQIERSNGSLLVRLSGEIDLSNSDTLHQQLESAVEGWLWWSSISPRSSTSTARAFA